MDFLINNWYVILGVVAVLIVAGLTVYKFAGLPTKEQLKKIKEWLLFATIQAEKELGSGTGKVKLRFVYDLFISKFPITAKLISFEKFSSLVDEALIQMEEILKTNEKVAELVGTEVKTDNTTGSVIVGATKTE